MGIDWPFCLDLRARGGNPLAQLSVNLLHIPLYAGLAFCVLGAVSGAGGAEEITRGLSWLTSFGAGAYAAPEEWHQSLVPGWHGSLGDFLLILRPGALREMDR